MSRATSQKAVLGLVLVLSVLASMGWVAGNGFVNYDDPTYIYDNDRVKGGISPENVLWALTSLEFSNWHPLTWMSHMLDVDLFGLRPSGHHLHSLLLHAANAVLLFLLLARMTGAIWRPFLVAALFAVHPLHVESVAWAAERKDVLSTLYWLLAMLAWLAYARRPSAARYLAAALLLAAGLAAKPMLVSLPLMLLLADWWPLGRLRSWRPVLEKLPLLLLSAAAGLLTYAAQKKYGAVGYMVEYPLWARIYNALIAYAAYLWKTVWPVGLAAFYPNEFQNIRWWQPASAALLLLALAAGALALGRRRPFLAFGWLWYGVTLLPVIGLVQVGSQSMADRYTYVPHMGLFLALAWFLEEAVRHRPGPRKALVPAMALILLALAAMTARQTLFWKDSITLFTEAIRVTKDNFVAYTNLGSALAEKGRMEEANAYVALSFKVNPSFRAEVHYKTGNAYAKRGLWREAAAEYRKALAMTPWDERIQDKLREAEARAAAAPQPPPGMETPPVTGGHAAGELFNRGNALARAGRYDEAAAAYRRALDFDPRLAAAWNNLGSTLMSQGKIEEAVEAYRQALRIDPEQADAKRNLANAAAMRRP